jgi:UTP--glucose-1-phosphate uridylyltransferase
VDEAPSNLAVAARYVFSPVIFDKLKETRPGKGDEIQLTDAIQLVLSSGGKGLGVRLRPDERRFDIGNFGSYFRAFVEFALADPQYGDGPAGTRPGVAGQAVNRGAQRWKPFEHADSPAPD